MHRQSIQQTKLELLKVHVLVLEIPTGKEAFCPLVGPCLRIIEFVKAL
jgi:hypothetical protein